MSLKIEIIKDKILSDNYFVLRNITYDLTRKNGEVIRHKREVYDRGNGATILLYNREKQSVVLIRQFRVATWVNGNPDGRLIETLSLIHISEPTRLRCFAKKPSKKLVLPWVKSKNSSNCICPLAA